MALSENRKPTRIAVVGAGTSGYLSVLYFCTKYPEYNIEWIYPKDNNPIGVGEGTVPDVLDFFNEMGITVEDIITKIGGSLKLGVKFEEFYKQDYFHPFGKTDDDAASLEFVMQNNKIPDNITSYNDIAAHFSVANLAKFLDEWFNKFDNLKITRKLITDKDEVDCDVFIDCTGFKRSFINQFYKDNTKEVKLPNNAALVYRMPIDEQTRFAYTTCRAMEYGWSWNIPLAQEIGIGYVHNDKFDVMVEFIDYIRANFNPDVTSNDIRKVKMITGRNINHYKEVDNTIYASIGLSSAFIEPMEATGLYLSVFGIKELDRYIHGEISGEEFNTLVNNEFDTIVDFIVAHYKFSHRQNDYWDSYKNIAIQKYKENNIFPKRSWNYILQENLPKLPVERMLKLRHGKDYSRWFNEKYS